MPGTVQSVERAAAMLQLLAHSAGKLSLGEVADSLDLAKTTTHGILRTLQGVGFVEQDAHSGRYQLGAALLHLGSSYLDVNELRARAINWADALASQTHESVRIATMSAGRVVVVHHVFRPDDSTQAMEVGAVLPAHATALGKVLLAWLPPAELSRFALERYTARTIASRRALAKALGEIRAAGWAGELEEVTVGSAAIAAPIRGPGGLLVGAIAVSGSPERLYTSQGQPRPVTLAAVIKTGRAISRHLIAGSG